MEGNIVFWNIWNNCILKYEKYEILFKSLHKWLRKEAQLTKKYRKCPFGFIASTGLLIPCCIYLCELVQAPLYRGAILQKVHAISAGSNNEHFGVADNFLFYSTDDIVTIIELDVSAELSALVLLKPGFHIDFYA